MKRKLFTAFIMALVLIAPLAIIRTHPRVWNWSNAAKERFPAAALAQGSLIGQPVRFSGDYLTDLSLRLGIYRQIPSGELVVRLLRGDQAPGSKAEADDRLAVRLAVPAAELKDNAVRRFQLPRPIPRRADGYFLVIEHDRPDRSSPVTVYLTPRTGAVPPAALRLSEASDSSLKPTPTRGPLELSLGCPQAVDMALGRFWLELKPAYLIAWLVGSVLFGLVVATVGRAKPGATRQGKAIIINVGLVLAGLVLVWGLGEAAVRLLASRIDRASSAVVVKPVAGPVTRLELDRMERRLYRETPTGRRLAPNVEAIIKNHYTSGLDVTVKTSSLGLRHPELKPKQAGEYRVLVIGDSITAADYLPFKQTYPAVLARELNKHVKSGRRIEVINAGVGALGVREEYHLLLETGLQTEPDLVLLGLYLNDAERSVSADLEPVTWPLIRRSKLAQFIARRIILFVADAEAAQTPEFVSGCNTEPCDPVNDSKAFDREIARAWSDWGAAWSEGTWDRLAAWLQKFKEAAARNRFRLVVCLFPVNWQVYAKYDYCQPQDFFRQTMTRLGLTGLDLLPPLRRAWAHRGGRVHQRGPEGYIYFDQCHLTARGNQVAAKALSKFLVPFLKTDK